MPPALPAPLEALLKPQAYAFPIERVELIETPISWVLLAGDFAYKIKRPVRLSFIDLTDPLKRKHLCEEEVRLNRRFAPELYLDVCRIVEAGGNARMGGEGEPIEYAVRMRRFPREVELDALLASAQVEPYELEAFGRELAITHATLPAALPESPWGRPAAIRSLIVRNLQECAEAAQVFGARETVLALRGPFEQHLERASAVMAERRARGRVRECHGDLHSRNIVRIEGRLIPFDCLEYEPAFRWIDVADEVAFLLSDLSARGRPEHAHAFLTGYLEQSGDFKACRLLRLYEAHRALVRAKVAALSGLEAGDEPHREALRAEHGRLLNHAGTALVRHTPVLVLMQGLSGSGKTWLARRLAAPLQAVHLRSDLERKRRAGLDALSRSRSGIAEGLYSSAASAAVYEGLARAACDALAGGYAVIVDAAFLLRGERARFASLGVRLGIPVHLVTCTAPDTILRARIAARSKAGHDPSEADEAVLDWQRAHLEPLSPEEPFDVIRLETADPKSLGNVLRRIAAPVR